jgi:hypothetical protein
MLSLPYVGYHLFGSNESIGESSTDLVKLIDAYRSISTSISIDMDIYIYIREKEIYMCVR